LFVLAVPAAAAMIAWEFHSSVAEAKAAVEDGCDGLPLGSIRVDENGAPQICRR
jgi:hypothetical protein